MCLDGIFGRLAGLNGRVGFYSKSTCAARPSPTPTLSPQQRKVGGASLPHPFGPQTKHNFYFWNMQIYCRRKGLCADKTLNCLASFFTVYGDILYDDVCFIKT